MTTRRQAREAAFQVLFAIEVGGAPAPRAITEYAETFGVKGFVPDPFFENLVRGVMDRRDAIDAILADASEHWRVDRMGLVDRNILRIGVYEIRFGADAPTRVAINEAVELAKRFGSEDSPAFVNGILDRVAQDRTDEPAEDA